MSFMVMEVESSIMNTVSRILSLFLSASHAGVRCNNLMTCPMSTVTWDIFQTSVVDVASREVDKRRAGAQLCNDQSRSISLASRYVDANGRAASHA
jgi:hypothetical protein